MLTLVERLTRKYIAIKIDGKTASAVSVARIDKYTSDDILFTADWCNLLPRRILGYKTPDDLFENELDKIYAA